MGAPWEYANPRRRSKETQTINAQAFAEVGGSAG